MESREFERWMLRAQQELEWGAHGRAIESLKRALGLDPEHAGAHAVLSLALLPSKRLHAARYVVSQDDGVWEFLTGAKKTFEEDAIGVQVRTVDRRRAVRGALLG